MALNPQFGTIVPSQLQQTLASNYLTFDGAAGGNFANNIYLSFMSRKLKDMVIELYLDS